MKNHLKFGAVLLALVCSTSLAQPAVEGVIYSCLGKDGVRYYTRAPIAEATCKQIPYSLPKSTQLVGTPSVLEECRDAPDGSGILRGASLRSQECTRIVCATDSMKLKIRTYALSKPQSEKDSLDALTCLQRKNIDSKAN